MAKRITRRATLPIESHHHKSAKRRNVPTEQTGRYMTDEQLAPVKCRPAPADGTNGVPRLSWARSEGLDDMAVSDTPLFIHEKIEPSAFVESLSKGAELSEQASLFGDSFNGLPKDAAYEWYEHSGNWQNRIIRGPSVEVMASLARKEGLSGKVQCIYFDPPYGISFKKSMQPNAKRKPSDAGTDSPADLPGDAPLLAAFRDTYVNGIDSYLDSIYRIARMGRELLAESGSFFLQISRKNLFRIALVLDEVFGDDNQVTIIPFKKSGGTASSMIPEGTDYILWYVRDMAAARGKYRQLYIPLTRREKLMQNPSYTFIESEDGVVRQPTQQDLDSLDKGVDIDGTICQRMRLLSQGHSSTDRTKPYTWKNPPPGFGTESPSEVRPHTFHCPTAEQWRVTMDGMRQLDEMGRLTAASPRTTLRWKRYENEIPGTRLDNLWHTQMSASDLHYVVETAESVIQRCILMTTDPGDLVLDPTCGSGTTAYVAESWGRRWITIDAGMAAVSLVRQRLATGIFDAHLLRDSPEGAAKEAELQAEITGKDTKSPPPSAPNYYGNDVAMGFVYERVPTVSAAILAYGEDAPPTLLVDQTIQKPKTVRVASPFTVESHSPYRMLSPEQAIASEAPAQVDVRASVTDALGKAGILVDGERIHVSGIQPFAPEAPDPTPITHLALIDGDKAAVAIAPDDASVNRHFMTVAQNAATDLRARTLLVIAFHFECDTTAAMLGRLQVIKARANQDLRIGGLRAGAEDMAFVCVGEPDVEIRDAPGDPDHCIVEIKGYDIYDPASGNATHKDASVDDVQCWMLDIDHDGESFYAHRIHFPGAGNDRQIKGFYQSLKRRLEPKLWAAALSLTSAPFPKPKRHGQIAIRIVTATHDEMTVVRQCE